MITQIVPNAPIAKTIERIERKTALKVETANIDSALKAWTPDEDFERIKDIEGLKDEVAKLRAIVLEMAKALYVSVAVDIEAIEETKRSAERATKFAAQPGSREGK